MKVGFFVAVLPHLQQILFIKQQPVLLVKKAELHLGSFSSFCVKVRFLLRFYATVTTNFGHKATVLLVKKAEVHGER